MYVPGTHKLLFQPLYYIQDNAVVLNNATIHSRVRGIKLDNVRTTCHKNWGKCSVYGGYVLDFGAAALQVLDTVLDISVAHSALYEV